MTSPYSPAPQPVVIQQSRNTVLAYVLWFFLGHLGVHKMYVGKWITGFVYLGLAAVGYATVGFLIGFLFLVPLWIMLLVDLFLIPGEVRRANAREAHRQMGGAYGAPYGR